MYLFLKYLVHLVNIIKGIFVKAAINYKSMLDVDSE